MKTKTNVKAGTESFTRKDTYKDKAGGSHDVLLQWDMNNTSGSSSVGPWAALPN